MGGMALCPPCDNRGYPSGPDPFPDHLTSVFNFSPKAAQELMRLHSVDAPGQFIYILTRKNRILITLAVYYIIHNQREVAK